MSTTTKPILTITGDQKIQHVTGEYSKEISVDDLKRHPEKYINIYPTFYKNLKAVAHEVNTRLRKVTPIGKKNVIRQTKAKNGVTYSILRGKNDKSGNR